MMSYLIERLDDLLTGPDKPLIKDAGRWYSKHELQGDIAKIQSDLAAAGVQPGDQILLSLPNSYTFAAAYMAVIGYGATVCPVNPEMPAYELRAFVNRCRPVYGIARGVHADELLNGESSLKNLFVADEKMQNFHWFVRSEGTWEERKNQGAAIVRKSREPAGDQIAILLYTSGTTGSPKAVGLTHDQVFAAAQNIIASHRLTSDDITYCFLPLFHINAEVVAVLSTLLSGGKIVLESKFSASKFWKTVCEEKITWISAVPAVISIILNIEKPKEIPDHLRFVRSASAQLPILHARRFEQEFGIPIIESYGMTEAASQICVNPLPPEKRVLGSVGIPVGVELAISDESGQHLPPKTVGEIVIRGKNIITEYVKAENQDDFRDGWFHTGDVGYVNKEGYVFIVGRKKELINRGGEKISPYEVEEVIRGLPGVHQVAVIGVPDPKYGEQVAACIVPENDDPASLKALEEAVMEHCRRSLSSYKCPSKIKFAEELPVGPTGKIQRIRLKQEMGLQKIAGQSGR